VEYRLIHQNGAIVYCFDQAVPVVHEQEEHFRMDGIIFDITVQKELQEKNLQTQELETLSQISRQLAHELRNPLTSIGGLARRIARSFEVPDNRAEKSQMILEQVQKLEKILNMMLTFISPQEITLKPVHFNSLIYRILKDLKQKNRALSSSVKVNLSQELDILLLDENLFEKALLSLIENAWARMGQKGELRLTTFKLGETANMVLTFQVPSLSTDDLEHYFYPFTIDYGMSKKTDREGIPDISVSKMIIYKHRGTVNVTQENERYLKLIITLPL
jgi:K+-sensing histidine kinase KdpD